MALGALARRAEHLPGLLSELRPHLKRLLVGQSDTLQAATLALLEALLPKEPDAEAGGYHNVFYPKSADLTTQILILCVAVNAVEVELYNRPAVRSWASICTDTLQIYQILS